MILCAAYDRLHAALAPLGIQIDPDVLDIWIERERHGQEPLPDAALRDLAAWVVALCPRDTSTTRATISNNPVTPASAAQPARSVAGH